ncbi:MAG: phosphate signaling complex protein PhoU [Methylococcaceae bacterium]
MGKLEIVAASNLFTNPLKNQHKIILPIGMNNEEHTMDNSIGRHISAQFDKELEDLRNKVLTMSGLVEQQIELAIEAFSKNDIGLAEQAIKLDNQVDALEMYIDMECAHILARRQPTAFDLRLLLTVMKIIHELERIGDRAESVAQMAIKLAGAESKFPHHELEQMANIVKSMLHDAMNAFARMTLENVSEISNRDDSVDCEYEAILRQLVTRMMKDPKEIAWTLDVLWTVRALERIGEHACDICEHLVFMIKGKDLRHLSHSEFENIIKSLS